MSRMLERERTPVPVRHRSPILDYSLIVLGAGFGMYADRAVEEDGHPSARSATGLTLAVIAVVGAAVAALFWIL